MNRNGTLVDPIYDIHTEGEIEASHFSPTGLVQVYTFTGEDFQKSGLYDEQYFFILKVTNFSGKITLTFLSSPKNSDKRDYVDKFFIIDNQNSININNQSSNCNFFYAFPVILKFVKGKCQIEPFQIPPSLQTMKTTDETLESMAKIDEMSIKIGQLICPKNKIIHKRYEMTKFNRVSLNEAFQKCQINHPPMKIDIAIGWDTYTDVDLLVFSLNKNGKLSEPICAKCKKTDSNKSIKSGSDSKRGASRGDNEITSVDLCKIMDDVNCLIIGVVSAKGIRFDCLEGSFIRIVDSESKKEVLFMNLEETEVIQGTGLIWGVLKKVNENWFIWPCCKFLLDCLTPKDFGKSLLNDFLKSGELESVFTS